MYLLSVQAGGTIVVTKGAEAAGLGNAQVPATPAGMPAIETLIGEGINVNVTLIFSLAHYEAVAEAYIVGLERLAANSNQSLDQVASVRYSVFP